MTLLEKLATIGKPPIRSLESGNVTSIEEFWNKVVSPVLPRKETVLAWHELLMAYVKSEHPCLAIRGYNSFPPERYCDLRRGFFTNAEEFSFFHTDNYFAAYFQKMVLDDFVPTLEEFSLAFDQRKFPSRFGQITTEEKALLAIPLGKDPRINVGGFKLAHIIPVGKEYCYDGKIMGIHDILVTYFPMGKRSDWTKQHDGWGEFYARDFVPDERAIKYAQAHFLRFVHPFNYFLCPKKKCESNEKCKEIAEYQPLLDYAHDYMLQTYGSTYLEYLACVMPHGRYADSCFDDHSNAIEISYGLDIELSFEEREEELLKLKTGIGKVQKQIDDLMASAETPEKLAAALDLQEKLDVLKKDVLDMEPKETVPPTPPEKSPKADTSKAFGEVLELQMAIEYLSNSKTSFRKLEKEFLGIESAARGGGFKAKEIINSLGITAEQKGILERVSIEKLMSVASGTLLSTLKRIKKYAADK